RQRFPRGDMIRIRPGRSWRLNPGYLGKLKAGPPRAFEGAGMLDVLGLEVAGVDLTGGIGDAQGLLGRDELSQEPARPWHGQPAEAGMQLRGAAGEARFELHDPPEAAARLAARALVPRAPLAPHLGRGRLLLRLPGAPALACEAPVLLALRNLIRDAAALIE